MFLQHTPVQILFKHWKAILLTGLVVATLAGGVSLVFPLEYRADAQVLIISQSRYGVDPYTVVKSAERVGENLVEIIKTNDFYNKVITQPGYNLDKAKFTNVTERTKRKNWQKAIKTNVVYGTGVLNISAYDKNPAQAMQYAGAVAATLSGQAWQYVGGDVIIKVINDPVATQWPARPNVVLNAVLGLIVGMFLGGAMMVRRG